MKKIVLSTITVLLGLTLIAFYKIPRVKIARQEKEYIYCEPAPTPLAANEAGKFISVLPGWGTHSYKVSTGNDSAQFYFNQGLNFYYSYHFKEALASFKESARFDKDCAMAYWGQALAMGPYYNNYFYKMPKEIPEVVKTMSSYVSVVNKKEAGLITAMQQRYSNDASNSDRKQLDSIYVMAMSQLAKEYPPDEDINALFVDATMLAHKWDFWYNDGRPKAWTTELVQTCQSILARNPSHPAALHYIIHVTEASKHPETALHSADVLKETLPGVGHMVHMATHMYQRNGLYAKGVYVNEDANTASNIIDSLAPNMGIGRNTLIHIFAVQSYCAMNAGMYAKGMPVYMRARDRLLANRSSIEQDAYSQYVFMMPVMARVRLGKWQEILNASAPAANWKYSSALDDFARGMANLRSGNIQKAKDHLASLRENKKDSLLTIRLMPFNKPVQCVTIAEEILQGEILQAEGKKDEAIAALRRAAAEEDKLIYCEPKDWLIPSRQFLGAILLKNNMPVEAEKIFGEDLVNNPGNGWSLMGMYRSMLMQKNAAGAARYKAAFEKAFAAADVLLQSSVL